MIMEMQMSVAALSEGSQMSIEFTDGNGDQFSLKNYGTSSEPLTEMFEPVPATEVRKR